MRPYHLIFIKGIPTGVGIPLIKKRWSWKIVYIESDPCLAGLLCCFLLSTVPLCPSCPGVVLACRGVGRRGPSEEVHACRPAGRPSVEDHPCVAYPAASDPLKTNISHHISTIPRRHINIQKNKSTESTFSYMQFSKSSYIIWANPIEWDTDSTLIMLI